MQDKEKKSASSRNAIDARKKKEKTLKETEQKLKDCHKQRDEYLAGWQRVRADFLNYKKEEMVRIEEVLKYKTEILILKILPILDSFDLAEEKLSQSLKDDRYIKGFLQIKVQIQDFLKNQGIKEIKTSGQHFDPSLQEIVEEVKIKNKKPGIVVKEVQKGYIWQGKLIRPAKVRVSK